jgi:GDP-L-fucose synthase
VAKIAAIKMCRYYNEKYETDFISVMPTNQYGPNDNFNLETAHVLPAMIRKFHLAKLLENNDFEGLRDDFNKYTFGFGKKLDDLIKSEATILAALASLGIEKGRLTLWGSGSPYREFLYVDDLASACLFLMEKYSAKEIGELINIGSAKDLQIKELAGIIKKVVGFDGELAWDKTKPDGTPKKLLDVSRLNKFGWQPQVSLAEGLNKIYSWYKGES